MIKRSIDLIGAIAGLILTAPLLAPTSPCASSATHPGPVFFRQTRLGMNMKEFTLLKFRTMKADTDDAPHREYIAASMAAGVAPENGGLYKLSREDSVTNVGRWLRARPASTSFRS